jgi:hypothetical protein
MAYAMNASHPLFSMCVFAVAVESSVTPPDLVSGRIPAIGGSSPTIVTLGGKQCLDFAVDSYLHWPQTGGTNAGTGLDLLSTVGSIFVIAETDIGGVIGNIISSVDSDVTTVGIQGFRFDDATNVKAVQFRTDGGTAVSMWNISTIYAGALQTVMVTWNGTAISFYSVVDGTPQAWGDSVIGAAVALENRRRTQLALGYSGAQLDGKIAIAYAFNGVLNLVQFNSLAADPYALVSAGGPPAGGIVRQMMHHGLYAHA